MKNLLHFTKDFRKSHGQPECTWKIVCEDRVFLSDFIFTFPCVGSNI